MACVPQEGATSKPLQVLFPRMGGYSYQGSLYRQWKEERYLDLSIVTLGSGLGIIKRKGETTGKHENEG